MTEHNLQTGDVLYDNQNDERLTVELIEGYTVWFVERSESEFLGEIELGIENGDYDHRPVRADGGKDMTEQASDLDEGEVVDLDISESDRADIKSAKVLGRTSGEWKATFITGEELLADEYELVRVRGEMEGVGICDLTLHIKRSSVVLRRGFAHHPENLGSIHGDVKGVSKVELIADGGEDPSFATKPEGEDPKSGERWMDIHNGREFHIVVERGEVKLYYDDGQIEGPFSIDEFNRSRGNLDYRGLNLEDPGNKSVYGGP